MRILIVTFFFTCIAGQGVFAQEKDQDPDRRPVNIDSLKINYGSVVFQTDADTLYLYINKDYNNLKVLTGEKKIRLPTGFHTFFIFAKNFPENEYLFEVKPDINRDFIVPSTAERDFSNSSTRAAYARLQWNANLIIETDRETEVWIEGKEYGKEFIVQDLPGGVYRVRFEHSSGRSHTELVNLQKHRLTHFNYFFLPSKKVSRTHSFVPGLAQIHKRQYIKAGAILAMTGIAIGVGISNNTKANTKIDEFYDVKEVYDRVRNNESKGLTYGNMLTELDATIHDFNRKRNTFYAIAGAIYMLNILDGLLREPKSGYRKTDILNPFRNVRLDIGGISAGLSLKLEF